MSTGVLSSVDSWCVAAWRAGCRFPRLAVAESKEQPWQRALRSSLSTAHSGISFPPGWSPAMVAVLTPGRTPHPSLGHNYNYNLNQPRLALVQLHPPTQGFRESDEKQTRRREMWGSTSPGSDDDGRHALRILNATPPETETTMSARNPPQDAAGRRRWSWRGGSPCCPE